MRLLSVVITGKNVEESLQESLSSCQAMHMPQGSFEILYLDAEASPFNSAVAKQMGVRTSVLKEKGAGIARCKNRAVKETTGEFIFFVDVRSVIHPDFARLAIEEFKESSVAVVVGSVREVNPARSIYCNVLDLELKAKEGLVPYVSGDMIVRRSAFEEAGGFDGALSGSETEDLSFRLFREGWLLRSLNVPMSLTSTKIDTLFQCLKHSYAKGYVLTPLYRKWSKIPSPSPKDLFLPHRRMALLFLGLAIAPVLLSVLSPKNSLSFFALFMTIFIALFSFLMVRIYRLTSIFREGPLLRFIFTLHHFVGSFPALLGSLAFTLDRLIGKTPR